VGDKRSGKQQIKDLGGLFTGKNKIEGGKIVPKNPPAPQPPPADREHIEIDITRH
jgi:hypothetical protein